MCESIHVWIYNCMNECDLFDYLNCRWLYDCIIAYDRWTRWNETKHVRWEAEWHRSTNTRQTSLEMMLLRTNRAADEVKPGIRWQLMSLGDKAHYWLKVWKKSSFVDQRRVFLHWCASAVMLFVSFFLLFWKSLTFAWTALSGFQSTGSMFLFYAPNFCLDRPFGFSVHQGALYCLSRLFRFSTFWAFWFFVSLDYDCILLKAEVLSIVLSHVSLLECNRSWIGCWCTLQLLVSSKKVCLLFTLFKKCKKKFCILKILLQVLPSKIEEIMQIE